MSRMGVTIGIPTEVKRDEFRVGATPVNVSILVKDGHNVLVQSGAGIGSGFSDSEYIDAGASITGTAKELYDMAGLIVKVKEPQASEYELLNEKHTLFCYLHLAPLNDLADALIKNRVCAIAYETIAVGNELPLLKPMSEIAGKMAPIVGAYHLSRYQDGSGVLISGSDGVAAANVLIIGAGNVGLNAAKIATGMGAELTVLNRTQPKLDELKNLMPYANVSIYTPEALEKELKESDLVISTVLLHGGATAPKLITRDMLKQMKNGSVFVDVAIDQGGVAETSRSTTHTDPIFVEEGVVHYCVANMPGAYPKTATVALTNATLPFVRKLAKEGSVKAIKNDDSIALGVNVYNGFLTNRAIADAQGREFKELKTLL